MKEDRPFLIDPLLSVVASIGNNAGFLTSDKEIVVYGICVQQLQRGTHDKEESVTVVDPITEISSILQL